MSHHAILKAPKYRKLYAFYGYTTWYCISPHVGSYQGDWIADETIWEGKLESPHLKEGDRIYISEMQKEVSIESVLRSTDGSVIYETDYKFDLVEDDETKLSKLKAKAEKISFDQKQLEKKLKQLEEETVVEEKSEVKKTWLQRLFTE